MTSNKKTLSYLILFFFLILVLSIFLFINKLKKIKDKELVLDPISINLLTSIHPNLNWHFKPLESKIAVRPGEVTPIKYMVENLGDEEITGIATFAYFPNQIGEYITKINCFCYGAQTLKPNQNNIYTLILVIDPEVTKDSKTKSIKEVTIQFTFFDYKEYMGQKNRT